MSFATDDRTMLDEWLTVGPARALDGASAAAPHAARLLGATLALWRDAEGAVQCRLGDAPLLVQARYGHLWVCPSGAPARPLFAFPEHDEPGRRIVDCGGIGVATSGLRVIENFLDMAHFPFVHPHLLGQVPHTEVREYRVETDAASGELLATGCRFWQPKSSAAASDGSEVVYRYRVMQPLSAMLYKSAYGRGDGALDAIALFVQPLSEERVVAHVLLAYLDDVTSTAELIAFQQTIFGQDKPILENHVPRRLPLDGRSETATRADLSSVLYRRWLAARGLRYGAQPRGAT